MATRISCSAILPEPEDAIVDGCPIRMKRRHISISKGMCGTAQWQLRTAGGDVADISECFSETSLSSSDSVSVSEETFNADLLVRFQGCDRGKPLAEVEGVVVDPAEGSVQFDIPSAVCQNAGIYQFNIGIVRDGSLIFSDQGLISVEHGLWGDTGNMKGPPTIQEIRFHLKDMPGENVLLDGAEYSDAEILEAIRWPVQQFNEKPPTLSKRYNCNNFPFRFHWLNAIVGRLLMSAAHNYQRNKMKVVSGGLVSDDKAKDDEYLRVAKMYIDEWEIFVSQKKVELNSQEGWGSFGSDYD